MNIARIEALSVCSSRKQNPLIRFVHGRDAENFTFTFRWTYCPHISSKSYSYRYVRQVAIAAYNCHCKTMETYLGFVRWCCLEPFQ